MLFIILLQIYIIVVSIIFFLTWKYQPTRCGSYFWNTEDKSCILKFNDEPDNCEGLRLPPKGKTSFRDSTKTKKNIRDGLKGTVEIDEEWNYWKSP